MVSFTWALHMSSQAACRGAVEQGLGRQPVGIPPPHSLALPSPSGPCSRTHVASSRGPLTLASLRVWPIGSRWREQDEVRETA